MDLDKYKDIYYSIAGLKIKLRIPDNTDRKQMLPSFIPFSTLNDSIEKEICEIKVQNTSLKNTNREKGKLLYEEERVSGEYLFLRENGEGYEIRICFSKETSECSMFCNAHFSEAEAFIDFESAHAGEVLSIFLMILFGQSALSQGAFLIHASVVEKAGEAYAFLGKSGTGKSTQSRLWIENIKGVKLLNDDNPVLKVENDGSVFVYGSPWSGKTPCYLNRRAKLSALVRIVQAPDNRFFEEKGSQAIINLLPSCASMRWNPVLYSSLCDLLEKTVEKTIIAKFECRPDKEAADLCYEKIIETKQKTFEI